MTGCRISEEDARDSHFDGLTDAEERAIATREHMERRDTLKGVGTRAKEKVDKMLEVRRVSLRMLMIYCKPSN